jgi:hypothetical protein
MRFKVFIHGQNGNSGEKKYVTVGREKFNV